MDYKVDIDDIDIDSDTIRLSGTQNLTMTNINVNKINQSLDQVNPFNNNKKRFNNDLSKHNNQTLNILEIQSDYTIPSKFSMMTLREILLLISLSSNKIDEIYFNSHLDFSDCHNEVNINSADKEFVDYDENGRSSTNTNEYNKSIDRSFPLTKSNTYNSSNNLSKLGSKPLQHSRSSVLLNDESTNRRSHINKKNLNSHSDNNDYQAVNVLRLRDLRRLDFQFNPVDEPNMIIRRHVVLLSFDPLRALIMSDRLIIIVPDGADSVLKILEDYIDEWKHNEDHKDKNKIPFESHAYEAILTTVHSLQSQDFNFLSKQIENNLKFFKDASILPIEVQEKMRNLKNSILSMKSRILGHKRVILELLEDDEDMALMNLSKLKYNPNYYKAPLVKEILNSHEDIEELLESYLMDYNSLESKIESLRVQIQSAEELVSLRLDTSRNELLSANTAMAVLACCIGFSAYVTGVFGMNLDQTIYLLPIHGVFASVFIVTFVLIPTSFFCIMKYYELTGVLPKKVKYYKQIDKQIDRPNSQYFK